jgi:predicted MFS family arabinose efflux permease
MKFGSGKWIIAAGFAVAAIGFLIAIVLDDRALAIQVFAAGFALTAIGMVVTIFTVETTPSVRRTALALKCWISGVVIASGSFYIEMFFEDSGTAQNVFFAIGAIVFGAGMVVMLAAVLGDSSWDD